MNKKEKRARVAIIGGGRVGTTLGYLLNKRGYKIETVLCRSLEHAKRAVKFIAAGQPATDLESISPYCNLLLITTPDSVIDGVSQRLSKLELNWKRLTAIHCSGYLSSESLRPLKAQGAAVASVHPLQTFATPSRTVKILKGSFFALEGDKRGVRRGRELIEDLGGIAIKIRTRGKPIYHCAASLACGHLAALVSIAVETMQRSGVKKREAMKMLFPLVQQTVRNGFSMSMDQALTGPIARGDLKTVKRHLDDLKIFSDPYLKIYKLLGRKILDLVAGKRLPQEKVTALSKLLR